MGTDNKSIELPTAFGDTLISHVGSVRAPATILALPSNVDVSKLFREDISTVARALGISEPAYYMVSNEELRTDYLPELTFNKDQEIRFEYPCYSMTLELIDFVDKLRTLINSGIEVYVSGEDKYVIFGDRVIHSKYLPNFIELDRICEFEQTKAVDLVEFTGNVSMIDSNTHYIHDGSIFTRIRGSIQYTYSATQRMGNVKPHKLLKEYRNKNSGFFGLDMETLGLCSTWVEDGEQSHYGAGYYPILSIAGISFDTELNEQFRFERSYYHPEMEKRADPVALNMHEKSGLLAKLRGYYNELCDGSQLLIMVGRFDGECNTEITQYASLDTDGDIFASIKNAIDIDIKYELEVSELPPYNKDFAMGYTLFGNSVLFDLEFMRHQLPMVTEFFHYRVIDVSSLQQFFSAFTNIKKIKKKYNHTALSDIEECSQELLMYKDKLSTI